MKCVIIANGELDYTKQIVDRIKDATLIISADGGARHLRALNILPHAMIGDFDSIHPDDRLFFKQKQVKTIIFPSRKNQTDTELCLSWALENKATDITFLGVTGTRLDHTLSNIFLLKKLARQHIPARIITKHNEIHVITDFIEIKGSPQEFLSIIPITAQVTGITLEGLEYQMVDGTLEMGMCMGVSNCFKETTASVSIKKGALIVIKSKD